MIVSVGSKNPAKLEGILAAFSNYFHDVELRPVDASSVSKAQPHGLDEMAEGATSRAKFALSKAGGDYGVGVEAGIFTVGEVYFDSQMAAVADASERVSLGHSAGYMLPRKDMEEMLRAGKELEQWAEGLSGISSVGDKGGVIQYLTRGKMTRAEMTEQCVVTALVPWLHPKVYRFRPGRPGSGTGPSNSHKRS